MLTDGEGRVIEVNDEVAVCERKYAGVVRCKVVSMTEKTISVEAVDGRTWGFSKRKNPKDVLIMRKFYEVPTEGEENE